MTTPYHDIHRPQFHFTAKTGWLNDPNGLVFFKGEYHLFFQHNPFGVKWGNMTWGHAVSRDMLHWRQLEHALLPDALGTMFSGSAVVDRENTAGFGAGALVCVYTAAGGTSEESKDRPFTQCLAYSTDGRTFTKYDGNPVLKQIVGGNRDPKVIWHETSRHWIMALFLDQNDFAFFASRNLKDWTHLQTMTVPDCAECPDFFPLAVDGDPARIKWVWTAANGRYLVGGFDGQRFVPDEPTARPLAGEHYYAVQTFSDLPDGRRIQIPWHNGVDFPGMPFNQQLGVPVELTLRATASGLRLCASPIREVESLRAWARSSEKTELAPDIPFAMTGLESAGYDVNGEVTVGGARRIEFGLCGIALTWDRATQQINGKMPMPARDGTIRFRALVDRASVEVFADDGEAIMVMGGPARMDDRQVTVAACGGSAKLEQLQVFGLRSVWPTEEG